ncbi:MAG TPA: hypothetical protein VFT67_00790 [Jatrophihabitantaceae bacterium]|nr:hypothetical protein [Jatrophihabitantaceae bacterium]
MALFSLRKVGLLVAATGAAHLVKPEAFEGISKAAFPDDTQAWVKRNGATELAIGAALAVPKLRKVGVLGLLGYVGFLGSRAKANGAF